jgi:hypothetical protein
LQSIDVLGQRKDASTNDGFEIGAIIVASSSSLNSKSTTPDGHGNRAVRQYLLASINNFIHPLERKRAAILF